MPDFGRIVSQGYFPRTHRVRSTIRALELTVRYDQDDMENNVRHEVGNDTISAINITAFFFRATDYMTAAWIAPSGLFLYTLLDPGALHRANIRRTFGAQIPRPQGAPHTSDGQRPGHEILSRRDFIL